ncbi:MAG: GNAT family N-acetyltransferase [Bacteriovoracia bacterium]
MGQWIAEKFSTRPSDPAQPVRELVVRHLTAADAPAFLEFIERIPFESTHTMQYVGMPARDPEKVAARFLEASEAADSPEINLGAFDGERVVGYLSARPERPGHPWIKHVLVFGMMVRREYWGQGIGQRLLAVQEKFARQHGVCRLEGMARVANEHGMRLYRRAGFVVEGTRKYAAFIDGEYQDEYFIAKILEPVPNAPVKSEAPRRLPNLKTERLILRPLALSDAPAIFAYAQNPNVSRWTMWEPHLSVKDTEAYILDYAFPYYRQRIPEPLGITLATEPSRVIGTVGLFWASERSRCMEMAFALDEAHWGKGIILEAAREIMRYAFEEFDLNRVQAHCKSENRASARVMEKLGMKFEGTRRAALFHRERYWDADFYAILRQDLKLRAGGLAET